MVEVIDLSNPPSTRRGRKFEPPSVRLAEEFAYKNSVLNFIGDNPTQFPLWSTSTLEMSLFGPGIGLYFMLLKVMGILFLISGFVAATNMVFNAMGGYYTNIGYLSVSIGNLGTVPPHLAQPILDVGYSAIFLIGIVICYRHVLRLLPVIDEHNITCADYSIKIDNVPSLERDAVTYVNHFKEFGEIAECAVALDNVQLIGMYANREKICQNLARAEMKYIRGDSEVCCGCCGRAVDKWRRKLRQQDEEIAELERQKTFNSVSVFVSFNSEKAKVKAIEHYRRRHAGHVCCGSCSCCAVGKPLSGKHLRVYEAPEPSNIIWKHLHIGTAQQIFRRVLTTFVTVILLSVGFGISFVAQFFKLSIGDYTSCLNNSTSLSSVLDGPCLFALSRGVGINAGTAVGVLVVNSLLVFSLIGLAKKEGHHTVTEEENGVFLKLWATQTINTGFVIMFTGLAYVWWLAVQQSTSGQTVIPSFSPSWYTVTGDFFMVTMFIQAAKPVLLLLLDLFLLRFHRWRARSNAVTQLELDNAYLGPKFLLAPRAAEMMMVTFGTLMFAPGLPVLLFVAAIYMMTKYWTDKYMLLRCARRPRRYTHAVTKYSLKLMPWAILLHTALAFFFYGAQRDAASSASNYISPDVLSALGIVGFFFSNLTIQQVPSVIMFGVLGGALVIFFLISFVAGCFRTTCKCCRSARIDDDGGTGGLTFRAASAQMKKFGLASYDPPFARADQEMDVLSIQRRAELAMEEAMHKTQAAVDGLASDPRPIRVQQYPPVVMSGLVTPLHLPGQPGGSDGVGGTASMMLNSHYSPRAGGPRMLEWTPYDRKPSVAVAHANIYHGP